MAEQMTIGIEIDGGRVTVVEVVKGHAVAVRTFSADNQNAALGAALGSLKQKRGDQPVRVVLAHNGVRMRRLDVTAQLTIRRNFEDAVFGTFSREGMTTAGLFFNPENIIGDTVSAGVGVMSPEHPVLAAYKTAGKTRTEIVPPPLSMIGASGLWFGLRNDTADLTLVVDGQPVAYRQLQAGGLGSVVRRLGEGGAERLRAVLSGGGMADPLAASELDLYLRQAADEITATIEFFRREGEAIPHSICVFGPGAHSGIGRILAERGFSVEMPDWLSKRLMYLPMQDREGAVGAFFAAATVGHGLPQSAFVNPDAARLAQELARRDQRAKYVLGGVVLAGLVVLIGVGPLVRAWMDTNAAKSSLAKAESQLEEYRVEDQQLRSLVAREDAITTLEGQMIPWNDALASIYDSRPFGARIVTLNATPNGDSVLITASIESGGGYRELAAWLTALNRQYGKGAAWSTSFTNRDGITSYDIVLTWTAESPAGDATNGDEPGAGDGTVTPSTAVPADPASSTTSSTVKGTNP